jgi:hypothetical protein
MGSILEQFEELAAEDRFQGWPKVGEIELGEKIPFFGRLLHYVLQTPRGDEEYVSLERNFGWSVVFGVTDGSNNGGRPQVITNVQWKPGINDIEWGMSPGGVGKMSAGATWEWLLARTKVIFGKETGYEYGTWEYLGSTNVESGKYRGPSPTSHGLRAHMFLATGLVWSSDPQPVENEIMDKLLVNVDQFFAEVLDARHPDGLYYFNEISAQLCAEKAFRRLVRLGLISPEAALRILMGTAVTH